MSEDVRCRCGNHKGRHQNGGCNKVEWDREPAEGCPCDVFRPLIRTGPAKTPEELWGETSSEGRKDDKGKPRPELIPPKALLEVAAVLAFGAEKYAADNWRKVPGSEGRYMGAALRHVLAHMSGEKADPETGLSHLSHAICCLLFVCEAGK